MSRESFYCVTLPGGDDRYVMFQPPLTPEQVRQEYPLATAVLALTREAWQQASGGRRMVVRSAGGAADGTI